MTVPTHCPFRPPRQIATSLVCAMSKKKLHLVPDKRKVKISDLSPEEEARILMLAVLPYTIPHRVMLLL